MLSRWLLVALLAVAAVHTIDLYQFESFEFDKVNHVAATSSWLQGRGFTIPDVAPAGLPEAVYRPLLGFLPGYALALAPLMRVTHEIWWSTYALDVAAQALFLLAWAILLAAVTGSSAAAIGLLLLWTILYSPVAAGTYSDLLALSLFSAALASAALAMSDSRALIWIGGLASAAFMAFACVVRYAYWPLVVVVPVAMVVAKRDRTAWTLAGIHGAVGGAAIAIGSWFMQRTTGEAVFLTRWYPDQSRGLYWSHLLTLNPFPADAIGAGRIYALLANGRSAWMARTPIVLWGLSALCMVVAAAYLVSRARRWLAGQLDQSETFFAVAGVLTCAATVAMNLWLTLRLPAVSDGWTVGAEPRYYLPALPFLGVALWLVARDGAFEATLVRTLAATLLLGALTVTAPVRAVRLHRYFTKNIETAWMSRGRRDQADVIVAAIRAVDAGGIPPLIIDDSRKWRRYVATMSGALVVTHEALRACAGRDGVGMRFLTTVPVTSTTRARMEGTSLGVAENVEIVSMVGSPCPPLGGAH